MPPAGICRLVGASGSTRSPIIGDGVHDTDLMFWFSGSARLGLRPTVRSATTRTHTRPVSTSRQRASASSIRLVLRDNTLFKSTNPRRIGRKAPFHPRTHPNLMIVDKTARAARTDLLAADPRPAPRRAPRGTRLLRQRVAPAQTHGHHPRESREAVRAACRGRKRGDGEVRHIVVRPSPITTAHHPCHDRSPLLACTRCGLLLPAGIICPNSAAGMAGESNAGAGESARALSRPPRGDRAFFHEKDQRAPRAERRGAGFEVTEKSRRLGGWSRGSERAENGVVRTDMDALPSAKLPGAYASKVRTKDEQGRDLHVMHACGHDLHMACGSARPRARGDEDQWKARWVSSASRGGTRPGRGSDVEEGCSAFSNPTSASRCTTIRTCPRDRRFTPGAAMATWDSGTSSSAPRRARRDAGQNQVRSCSRKISCGFADHRQP